MFVLLFVARKNFSCIYPNLFENIKYYFGSLQNLVLLSEMKYNVFLFVKFKHQRCFNNTCSHLKTKLWPTINTDWVKYSLEYSLKCIVSARIRKTCGKSCSLIRLKIKSISLHTLVTSVLFVALFWDNTVNFYFFIFFF